MTNMENLDKLWQLNRESLVDWL